MALPPYDGHFSIGSNQGGEPWPEEGEGDARIVASWISTRYYRVHLSERGDPSRGPVSHPALTARAISLRSDHSGREQKADILRSRQWKFIRTTVRRAVRSLWHRTCSTAAWRITTASVLSVQSPRSRRCGCRCGDGGHLCVHS